MSYVYVFDFGDMVKVGISQKPSVRLRDLEEGNGVRAVRTFAVNTQDRSREIELKVHAKLSQHLLQGKEYFSCPFPLARDTVVEVATQTLERHVSGIKVGGVARSASAQQRATAKYNKKTYDRIEIKVKKGQKEKIVRYAAERGLSANEFITKALYDAMQDP